MLMRSLRDFYEGGRSNVRNCQVSSEKPSEWSVRTGDISLSNVLNKCNDDGLFDVAITHPKLLAAMRLTLGDSFRLFSLNVRGAGPGHGHQAFHTVLAPGPPPLSLWFCATHRFDACADRIGARIATRCCRRPPPSRSPTPSGC